MIAKTVFDYSWIKESNKNENKFHIVLPIVNLLLILEKHLKNRFNSGFGTLYHLQILLVDARWAHHCVVGTSTSDQSREGAA